MIKLVIEEDYWMIGLFIIAGVMKEKPINKKLVATKFFEQFLKMTQLRWYVSGYGLRLPGPIT